jgi:hypothetical protein
VEHTLTLFLDSGLHPQSNDAHWMIRFTDPAVIDLFGGDTIPTAFSALMPIDEVVAYLREHWPGYEIKIEGWPTSGAVTIQ